MKNLLFSVFAIGVAAVAAMTATTAMLNAPHREDPATVIATSQAALTQAQQEAPPATAGKPAGEGSATPAPEAKPAGAAGAPAADTKDDEEGDKDPYEGIPEEELPPDMQYSADSSVSFPTNI